MIESSFLDKTEPNIKLSQTMSKCKLVGDFIPSEKYKSQWEGLSHILWKNKKCSKPPTSMSKCKAVLAKSSSDGQMPQCSSI
jgi:hypothetical protein